jgi:hypothetical protein
MAIPRQIKYVRKSYGVITHIAGPWGTLGECKTVSEKTAIKQIDAGTHFYHVKVSGYDVPVIAPHHGATRYLRTDPDHSVADNLGNLPDIPLNCPELI